MMRKVNFFASWRKGVSILLLRSFFFFFLLELNGLNCCCYYGNGNSRSSSSRLKWWSARFSWTANRQRRWWQHRGSTLRRPRWQLWDGRSWQTSLSAFGRPSQTKQKERERHWLRPSFFFERKPERKLRSNLPEVQMWPSRPVQAATRGGLSQAHLSRWRTRRNPHPTCPPSPIWSKRSSQLERRWKRNQNKKREKQKKNKRRLSLFLLYHSSRLEVSKWKGGCLSPLALYRLRDRKGGGGVCRAYTRQKPV